LAIKSWRSWLSTRQWALLQLCISIGLLVVLATRHLNGLLLFAMGLLELIVLLIAWSYAAALSLTSGWPIGQVLGKIRALPKAQRLGFAAALIVAAVLWVVALAGLYLWISMHPKP
jgi:hypothetical protein